MQTPAPEFWLNFLFIALALGSLAVWLPIAVRWSNEGTVLPYEPRARVPWNVFGAAPALLMVALTVSAAFAGSNPQADFDPERVFWELLASVLVQLGIAAATIVMILHLTDATRVDFGLPRDVVQLRGDVALGAIGWLAALLPVFATQWMLFQAFGEPSQNPLIQRVQEHRGGWIFAAAFLSAVIAAPILEELFFRVLLQGWLERVEDDAIHFPNPPPPSAGEGLGEGVSRNCNRRLIPGVSHGFVPILISSLLFSLAHISYGPDPVALFVLALFLGYLYQRTHRIVPCIVVHMLFNAVNLLVLWLSLQLDQHP